MVAYSPGPRVLLLVTRRARCWSSSPCDVVSAVVVCAMVVRGISALSALTALVIGQNSFSGTIPTTVGTLARLQQLGLNGNQLSGTIPTNTGSLNKLIVLSLV